MRGGNRAIEKGLIVYVVDYIAPHKSEPSLAYCPTALRLFLAGDGTTSVVVLCGSLLDKCSGLLEKGIHPTIITEVGVAC